MSFPNYLCKQQLPYCPISSAEGEAVTPTAAFEWAPDTSENAIVDISAAYFNTEAGTAVTVECTVNDDGAFIFSAYTQAEMGAGFVGDSIDYSRTRYELIESGSSVLVVSNSADC